MERVISHLQLEPFAFDPEVLAAAKRPVFRDGDSSNFALSSENREFIVAWTKAESEWLEATVPRLYS